MNKQQLWMICTCELSHAVYCNAKSPEEVAGFAKHHAYTWMAPFVVAVNLSTGEEVHVFNLPETGGWCVTQVPSRLLPKRVPSPA